MSIFPPGPTIPGQPGTPAFPPPGPPPTPAPLPAAPTAQGRGRGHREAFQDQQEAYAAQVAATNAANARASAAYNASLPPQTGLQANTGFTGSVQGAGNTSAPGFIPPSVSRFISPSAVHALGLAGGGLTLGAAMTQAGAQPNIFARPPINITGIQDVGAGTAGMPSLRRGPVATGPGLDPSEGFLNQGGPGVGYRTPVPILTGGGSMPSYMFEGSNDWTWSSFSNPQLFAELADSGSSAGADAAAANAPPDPAASDASAGWGALSGGDWGWGGPPPDYGMSISDAFGSGSFSQSNFSDPMSGYQMPPVDTSQQNTPSWMAPLGTAFEQFFNPPQQPAEIWQGGLPATPDFQPTFANMEQAFQGGLPASPGPPETPPSIPDYQGGLPASPGPPAPLSATEQIIQELQGQQQQTAFQGGLPAAVPESTFAATDLGSFLSALRGGGADVTSTFQGGLPSVPASPEGIAGAAVQADPLGMMGGLPAAPPPSAQGFGGGSPAQEASQVPQAPGGTALNPDLPPEVQAAGMFGGSFPNTSWPAFEAGANPSQNIEDMRPFAIPAAEPDSSSFIWPDASNPNRDILGSSPLTTLAPSDAGLPSGSPGLTPDVVSPTVPFGIQPMAQAPDFGGLPAEPNQAVSSPDFGGLTLPVDPLQGQGFGGGSRTEEPQGWPNFAPKPAAPEPMETWTIPQSKADLLIQKYGQTPTLRQIVVGENGSEPFGFSFLGSGVDTPIDLSKPIEPQLAAALGSMAGQAIPLIMGKMAGAGMSAADIQGAARGAATPNYFPPGSGPGTGPIAGPEALSGPSNFTTLQSGSPWGAEPSMEPQTMPGATDLGPPDALSGPPAFPTGQFASSIAPLTIGETGAVPNKVSGTVSFGDYENYPFISGGTGPKGQTQGALPYGNYNIDFGGIGPKGSSLNYTPWGPAVAGVTTDASGNAVTGTFWNNDGIEIHAVGNGPNSYTLGCFGITADSWPGFKSELQQFADQNGGQLTLSIQPGENGAADAVATIAPKNPEQVVSGEPPTAQAAVPPPDQPGVAAPPTAVQQQQGLGDFLPASDQGFGRAFVGGYNQAFGDSPLSGETNARHVIDAATAAGVPPELVTAIMELESGHGTSAAFRQHNNPAGLMDPHSPNQTGFLNFPNVSAGINAAVANIAKNYNTAGGDIGRLGAIYAPPGAANDPNRTNAQWVPNVTRLMGLLPTVGAR